MSVLVKITPQEYETMIANMYPKVQKGNFSEVIAVMRGGMIASQYISRTFNLPCGVYSPQDHLLVRRTLDGPILFVDDHIGVGKTVRNLALFMDTFHPMVRWNFFPVFIDSKYSIQDRRIIDSFRSDKWLVAPGAIENKSEEFYENALKTRTREYARDELASKEDA